MKVLIVARRKNGRYAPFITEQVDSIQQQGVECRYLGVTGKGVFGYLRELPRLRRMIHEFHPDIIHAHYGLCGLLANYQRTVPVVTTYHGSDINDQTVRRLSLTSIRLSRFNIFVAQRSIDIIKPSGNYALIPCGINLDDYPKMEKDDARRVIGLNTSKKYVLFSGAFDNSVKNVSLAVNAVALVPQVQLIELKGYTRAQVCALMQAVDVLLMTSHSEGSPQVVKEALACGCPIVSVDVGDVWERIRGVEGCFCVDDSPVSVAEGIISAISFGKRTEGRKVIESGGLMNRQIADRIIKVYSELLKGK